MGKKKIIKGTNPHQGGRIGVSSTQDIPNNQTPHFNFEFLQKGFCISDCEVSEKTQVLDSLHTRGQMRWVDIINSPKHGLGTEKIDKSSIKAAIPKKFKDENSFLAIRAIGKAPAVGVRQERVFYVIWVDRKFTLYDHGS